MFVIDDDLTIHITRGDVAAFTVDAFMGEGENKVGYNFRVGDVVRFTVCGKKDYGDVVLQKDFAVTEETAKVDIILESKDTRIGTAINKPKEYWYEIELNPETNPQTIIGHTQDGARVFMLYPEGVKEVG